MKTPLAGWLRPDIASAMRYLILTTQPDVMVEIGVFAGKSLVNAAEALKEVGHGVIYGIDPWRHEEAVKGLSPIEEDPGFWNGIDLDAVHYDCMRAIWDRGLEQYAIVIRAASQHAAQLFSFQRRDECDVIDILYIDGGHSEEVSCRDVNLYLPLVKQGGYIWLDDADWSSIRKATELLKASCDLQNDYGHCQLYRKK